MSAELLRKLLALAVIELDKHNSDWHHTTNRVFIDLLDSAAKSEGRLGKLEEQGLLRKAESLANKGHR